MKINPIRLQDHESIQEIRKYGVLSKFNLDSVIINLNCLVEKVRELDEKDNIDNIWFCKGFKYEVTIGYPCSMGENGYTTEFIYTSFPTIEDIKKDVLEFYSDEVKTLKGKELPYGGYAISGTDEMIVKELEDVLKYFNII